MDPRATFFTISDERFVPGTIAMLNSLRLQGHREPLVILDCGMRADQRRLLERHASLIPWDRHQAKNPTLFKAFAQMTDPRGVAVIIDSDMLVTGSLRDILQQAADGLICAFPDPESDRWFAEWQDVFGLARAPRRQAYVNAGFVCLSTDQWPGLLPRWWELCRSIWTAPTLYEGAADGPTAQGDQDALNALLMSEVAEGSLRLLDPDLAPAGGALAEGVAVVNDRTLACSYRGKPSLLLHSVGKAKPWLLQDWPFVRGTAYTRLLRRVSIGEDVAVRPLPADLPPWLRRGAAGSASMAAVTSFAGTARRLADVPIVKPMAQRIRRALLR